MLFLSDKLPQPNYEKQASKNYHSFTNKKDLSDIPQCKMKKIKEREEPKVSSSIIKELQPIVNSNKQKNYSIEGVKREQSPKQRMKSGLRISPDVDNNVDIKKMELPQLNIVSSRKL